MPQGQLWGPPSLDSCKEKVGVGGGVTASPKSRNVQASSCVLVFIHNRVCPDYESNT